MAKSESIKELAAALVKVQADLKPAPKSSDNPFFGSKYADLTGCWEACRALLAANGLAVVQGTNGADGLTVTVETTLLHVSGEWMSSSLTIKPSKPDPQGIGSAITYGRRYALSAMVGICTDDDDGNAASRGEPPPPQRAVAPKSGATDKKKALAASIVAWSGVKPEDQKSAMNAVKRACGIKTAAATDAEIDAMAAFVAANKDMDFMAITGETK